IQNVSLRRVNTNKRRCCPTGERNSEFIDHTRGIIQKILPVDVASVRLSGLELCQTPRLSLLRESALAVLASTLCGLRVQVCGTVIVFLILGALRVREEP